jgi:hypothetical protein
MRGRLKLDLPEALFATDDIGSILDAARALRRLLEEKRSLAAGGGLAAVLAAAGVSAHEMAMKEPDTDEPSGADDYKIASPEDILTFAPLCATYTPGVEEHDHGADETGYLHAGHDASSTYGGSAHAHAGAGASGLASHFSHHGGHHGTAGGHSAHGSHGSHSAHGSHAGRHEAASEMSAAGHDGAHACGPSTGGAADHSAHAAHSAMAGAHQHMAMNMAQDAHDAHQSASAAVASPPDAQPAHEMKDGMAMAEMGVETGAETDSDQADALVGLPEEEVVSAHDQPLDRGADHLAFVHTAVIDPIVPVIVDM